MAAAKTTTLASHTPEVTKRAAATTPLRLADPNLPFLMFQWQTRHRMLATSEKVTWKKKLGRVLAKRFRKYSLSRAR